MKALAVGKPRKALIQVQHSLPCLASTTFSPQVRGARVTACALTFTLQRLVQFECHGSRDGLARGVNLFFLVKCDLKLLKFAHVFHDHSRNP